MVQSCDVCEILLKTKLTWLHSTFELFEAGCLCLTLCNMSLLFFTLWRTLWLLVHVLMIRVSVSLDLSSFLVNFYLSCTVPCVFYRL